jgi:cytochrome c553
MRRILFDTTLAAALSGSAQAADPARGASLAGDCAACHGPTGVSVSGDIPNLAAQKEDYIATQLTAFRRGDRTNALMNPVAAGLSDDDIADLAAHFAGLPGAEPGAVGPALAALDGTVPAFPADFRTGFVRYHTIDFPDRKQVRHYWADAASAAAAKAGAPPPDGAYFLVEVYKARLDAGGQPVTGADGHFEADTLALYTAMQKIAGAGAGVPGIFANGDWRYALFATDGTHRSGTNEAKCLACHKPEAGRDYVFTLDQLAEFAKGN